MGVSAGEKDGTAAVPTEFMRHRKQLHRDSDILRVISTTN